MNINQAPIVNAQIHVIDNQERLIERQTERIHELERVLAKSAIRFHALSIIKEVGEHNGTFTECKSEICREHRTIITKGKSS